MYLTDFLMPGVLRLDLNLNSERENQSLVFHGIRIQSQSSLILRIYVTISLKLVLSQRVIQPLRKYILRRICPIERKFLGFVVLSKFSLQDEQRAFPSITFCQSYALKSMLNFLYQISLVVISCVCNFSKISLLITVSYLSSFKNCRNYSLLICSCQDYLFSGKPWLCTAGSRFIQQVPGYKYIIQFEGKKSILSQFFGL